MLVYCSIWITYRQLIFIAPPLWGTANRRSHTYARGDGERRKQFADVRYKSVHSFQSTRTTPPNRVISLHLQFTEESNEHGKEYQMNKWYSCVSSATYAQAKDLIASFRCNEHNVELGAFAGHDTWNFTGQYITGKWFCFTFSRDLLNYSFMVRCGVASLCPCSFVPEFTLKSCTVCDGNKITVVRSNLA